MSDLVRVRVDGREFNVGRAYATAHNLTVLDEPARDRAGALRPVTRAGGRPVKPKVSVASAAAKKAATKKAAVRKKAAVKKAEPADSNDTPPSKEN